MRADVIFETEDRDARLEVPWKSPGGTEFVDLRGTPTAIREIEPARRHRPLHNFLTMLNSGDSVFSTAYCKVWLEPERGETSEFASQIDVFFAPEELNLQRGHYEGLCEQLLELLTQDAGDTLRAELHVRRCHFRASGANGYCLAIVLRAQGETAGQAELRWGLGLARVQQALLFVSRGVRHWLGQTG
jgi:hypothetical protein